MAAFHHHFMPLEPPLEGDSYRQLQSHGLVSVQTKDSGHVLLVRFLCLNEKVRVIAVTVPEDAANHQDLSRWMKQILENSITALRLSVDTEAAPIPFNDGFIHLVYPSDDPEPKYEFPIDSVYSSDYRLNINHVAAVFGAVYSRVVAPIAALLAEGLVRTIPPHYRVLSAIRAIELLYPDERTRDAVLNSFDVHFKNLNISNFPLRRALPQLRTRCAHGLSRGRTSPEPFVGAGVNEPHLMPLLTLLQSIAAVGLQDLHGVQMGNIHYYPEPEIPTGPG